MTTPVKGIKIAIKPVRVMPKIAKMPTPPVRPAAPAMKVAAMKVAKTPVMAKVTTRVRKPKVAAAPVRMNKAKMW